MRTSEECIFHGTTFSIVPIQLLPLPRYSSWANPIEKVWRKLRQDVLHQHRWAEARSQLRLKVNHWLDALKDGSLELLRYIGLKPSLYYLIKDYYGGEDVNRRSFPLHHPKPALNLNFCGGKRKPLGLVLCLIWWVRCMTQSIY
jgi:hypothetical protein